MMKVFDLQHDDYDEIATNGVNCTIDAAFKKVRRTSAAFFIWKIEKMNVAAIPKDQYGIFYDTDAYIIYAASQKDQVCGTDTVSREIKGCTMEYHIHFWLGSQTNPDRSGVAAYKTVELDSYLNSCATQHRETEGNESPRFLSYFKNGMRIFRYEQIADCQDVRLYRVKGKRIPVLKEMSKVSWDFFNSADIFLMATRKNIFMWTGRAADAVEKLHATNIAIEMKEDLKLSNILFVDDGYEKTLKDDIKIEFNKYLPLENRLILPENHDADENGNYQRSTIKLYKCTENNGKYRVVELKSGPLSQKDLSAEDVFIIDHDIKGIWVWVGKKANDKERSEALRNARGFVKKKAYSSSTQVTRVVDGYEPCEFKMLFASWLDHTKGSAPKIIVSKYDADAMEDRPSLSAETQLIDDGAGSTTVWRVKQTSIVEVPKERHGVFFSGDCYIVLYTYHTASMGQKHLLYSWVGSHASQDEINSTIQKLDEIDDEMGQLGFQARIIQGRETAHLLQIFKGKFTIFKGKGSDYDETGKNLKSPSQYLLQVFGSTTYSSKAIQVSIKASSFNSNYCFVLKRGKKAFIWSGTYSTGDQREMAKGFAGKDIELVSEGKEKEDFFHLLGGKSPYSTQMMKTLSDPRPPRLFHCRSFNGSFTAQEMIFFGQKDLIPEHVMLLDTNDSIYMWIGNLASNEERKSSARTAMDYLQTDPSGRDMNIAVIHIKQEKEPPSFKGFFPTWDNTFWKDYKTFSRVRHDLEMKNVNTNGMDTNGVSNHDISCHSNFDQFDKYPVTILREPNDKLPARIDSLNKELHLTHDDFVSLFKMPYIEFEKLTRWKQQEMKKKVGLF
ncbi:unnamed protein product [Phaedon cochleariae]|uniref:HP domain-containing protein n=1 Tax=Phaedon cochleariae TaxID=80249 RepID=A0A9P0GMJ5_PHACE|nr:unnamed protein product [Phaedon cochleariae]